MPLIRKTTKAPGAEDKVENFNLPHLRSDRINGEGVNNKVLYDLKKRGKSVVDFESGKQFIFEVVTRDANP